MKNYEDISEENAFFEGNEEPILLPELRAEPQRRRAKWLKALPILILTAAIALAVALSLSHRPVDRITVTLPTEESEEWRGAFNEREVLEAALEASVTLSTGAYDDLRRWSGVVLSNDGWLATASCALDDEVNGRVYAILSNGREYEVEQIFRGDRMTLMKISANDLCIAELFEGELHSGERVSAIECGEKVLSTEISNASTVSVNAAYSDSLLGAPLFDDFGRLVGMVCQKGQAVTAEDIKSVFSKIK